MKLRNFVAKDSRNKSGAGAHRSDKDYDRANKQYKIDAEELIAIQEAIDALRAEQQVTHGVSDWARIEEEIGDLEDQLKEI